MKLVNCVTKPLSNEYGSTYGTDYIFFPARQVSEEDIRIILGNELCYLNIYERPFNKVICLDEDELFVGSGGGVWSQIYTTKVDSLEEAIKLYLED